MPPFLFSVLNLIKNTGEVSARTGFMGAVPCTDLSPNKRARSEGFSCLPEASHGAAVGLCKYQAFQRTDFLEINDQQAEAGLSVDDRQAAHSLL